MSLEQGTMDSTSPSVTNPSSTIIPVLVLLMTTTILSAAPRPVAGEPPSVVPFACKDATAAGGGTFTEAFCLTTLQGKPSAGAADYADLALITVDLTTANATATEAKIDGLLASNNISGVAVVQGLQSCWALYGKVVRQYQPECRADVKDGRYGDGKMCLGRTAQAVATCERWFQRRKVPSPVAREDDVLAKLANLAIALASIVK